MIWLDWGRDCVRDFKEPWVEHFANPAATSFDVECVYCGNLVARQVLVAVDGYRAVLPIGRLVAPGGAQADYVIEVSLEVELWARLIHGLTHAHHSDLDTHFKQAGMRRV